MHLNAFFNSTNDGVTVNQYEYMWQVVHEIACCDTRGLGHTTNLEYIYTYVTHCVKDCYIVVCTKKIKFFFNC